MRTAAVEAAPVSSVVVNESVER